jgi:excisionase family DNA binding protein
MTIATAETRLLLTIEEAAERLGIGRTKMVSLVSSGAIESVTIGRLRRIPIECLNEYVVRLRAAHNG